MTTREEREGRVPRTAHALGIIPYARWWTAAAIMGAGDRSVGGLVVAPSWVRARLNEDAQVGAALSD